MFYKYQLCQVALLFYLYLTTFEWMSDLLFSAGAHAHISFFTAVRKYLNETT